MLERAVGSRRVAALTTLVCGVVLVQGCSDPERQRLKATTKATYDQASGKLTELTFDANKNGRIDTWTEMEGARPLRSKIDSNEDGRIDRWEYYDAGGKLTKVGFSRKAAETPDAWAFAAANGGIERIELSSAADPAQIDRWEFYEPSPSAGASDPDNPGTLLRVEVDTNADGRPDKWERYSAGMVSTVEFDENHDGRPDRRLTYKESELALIETSPDAAGHYQKAVSPK
jgi:hypothetical protein